MVYLVCLKCVLVVLGLSWVCLKVVSVRLKGSVSGVLVVVSGCLGGCHRSVSECLKFVSRMSLGCLWHNSWVFHDFLGVSFMCLRGVSGVLCRCIGGVPKVFQWSFGSVFGYLHWRCLGGVMMVFQGRVTGVLNLSFGGLKECLAHFLNVRVFINPKP